MIEAKQKTTFIQKHCWNLVIGFAGVACLWWDLEPILFQKLSEHVHLPFDIDKPLPPHLR